MKRFYLLLILGVAAYTLAFPPVDWGPLSMVALAAFGLAFRTPTMRFVPWLATYLAGVVLFWIGNAWIAEVNPVFPLLMALAEGLALPLFCLFFRSLTVKSIRFCPVWIALPMAWLAAEYLRSYFPLDGYPWLLAGYTLWKMPLLIQIADLAGVAGPGFLVALAAGLLVAWIDYLEKREPGLAARPLAGTGFFLLLLTLVLLYGWFRPRSLELRPGPVLAAIQGNIPQELKNDENLSDVMYRQFLETTRSLFDAHPDPVPDLVIWPETVFPFPLGEGKPGDIWYKSGYGFSESDRREKAFLIDAIVKDLLAPRDIWFLTGVLSLSKAMDGKVQKRNGVYLYDPLGERRHAYYKTILVPGGEYLPLLDVIPFLRGAVESYANQVAGLLPDLSPGFGPAVMTCEARGVAYRFGVQICFENIYGDYCRRFIKEGAEFLINISNEGWFKESAEFDQMLAMSVFRAIETRRTLFRSTNTGISCMISPLGGIPGPEDRIVKDGRDRAVQGVLIRRVPLCEKSTLYTEVGDLFWKILFYGQIVLWALLLLQKIWVTNTSLPE